MKRSAENAGHAQDGDIQRVKAVQPADTEKLADDVQMGAFEDAYIDEQETEDEGGRN